MLAKTTSFLGLQNAPAVEEQPDFTRLTFDQSTQGAANEYIFMMIRGLFHVYPSGDDNRTNIDAADLFWDFFQEHAGE